MSGQTTTRDWRGVAAEQQDEVPEQVSFVLRNRSRRLLADLLRPYRSQIVLLIAVIVVCNAASLAIPFLVKVGIDTGIPPMRAGEGPGTLLAVVAAVLTAAVTQAVTRQAFLKMAAGSARASSWSCGGGSSATSSGCRSPSTRTTPRAGSCPASPPTSTPSPRCSSRASTASSPPC
nr:hypothetical protein GCM10020093_013110 [Planobispora longispora]